jgi:hypothetical protein
MTPHAEGRRGVKMRAHLPFLANQPITPLANHCMRLSNVGTRHHELFIPFVQGLVCTGDLVTRFLELFWMKETCSMDANPDPAKATQERPWTGSKMLNFALIPPHWHHLC